MLHCGTTAGSTVRSRGDVGRNSSQNEKQIFVLGGRWKTQKHESEQPFEALSWRLVVYGVSAVVPRAHWKGFLKLSLVSCPVALYPAVAASERISFRQINKDTGNRLRQQLVDVVTGEPVQAHNKGRGYEVGEDQYLLVRDEELEAAEQEGRRRPYSSVPAAPREEHNEAPQPVSLHATKPLFNNTPIKAAPRREDAPQ